MRGSAAETSTEIPYRWQQDAECKGEDTDLFFDPTTYGIAATLCARCTVREECLADAYKLREFQSFRGGMSPRARENAARGKRVRRVCALCPASFKVSLRSDRSYCGPECQAKAKAQALGVLVSQGRIVKDPTKPRALRVVR